MGKNDNNPKIQSLYTQLIENYVPEIALDNRSILSIKEKGKIYYLTLSSKLPTIVFRVDGVIITSGLRCDKLVLVNSIGIWDSVFVELKGIDVGHAIKQLRSTITNRLFNNCLYGRLFARIVGTSYPSNKSNPVMERAKKEFKSKYHCDLRALRSKQPDTLK